MKNLKVLVAVLSLILIAALVLRIRKVRQAESITTTFSGLKEGDAFVAATYYPVPANIIIHDSLTFYPGNLFVQDVIEKKHRFFIFSSYYEKAPGNEKYLMYSSNGQAGKHKFVIQASRDDTTFNQVTYTKEKGEDLRSYSLEDTVIDTRNSAFAIRDFEKVDTLKFYIKQTYIQSGDRGDYYENNITLKKEPVDSVLFVRKKNKNQQTRPEKRKNAG